jgi:ribonuclease HI|tara:strand:- start:12 stop:440 length:429 start_codon:yes stop_codon:yes gene_type:complete
MNIKIYTDGACSGNPGIGGWGVILLIPEKKPIYLNGGLKDTTNNQMELTATIKGLEYFSKSENIKIFTDSKYVMNGIESWILNWKKNGWKTANKKPVKNKDLWINLDIQKSKHQVTWEWVKGHAGDKYNEKADQLARKFIEE